MKREKITPEEKALRMEEWKHLVIERKYPHEKDPAKGDINARRKV